MMVHRPRVCPRVCRWLLALSLPVSFSLAGCGEAADIRPPVAIVGDSVPFEYPIALWDTGIEGEVGVMVHVTHEGGVDSVFVVETSGEPAMDSAAVAGAYELRFTPGRRGDRRIDAWVRVPVRFRKPGSPGEGAE